VRSARYAGEGAGDRANLEKVMGELDGVPAEKRQARFVCVVALQTGEGEVIACQGACEGRIGFEPRGANGFGYDPVFIPEGFDRTFAELDDSEKNAMSHRGRALGALRRELARRYGW
jgi:XTP/dITP diphosphohydrolase